MQPYQRTMGDVRRLIARYEALNVGAAESGRQAGGPSDRTTVQGTASSSADVPQTTVPDQDPCSSSPHPNLSTISTEGTGRQAGPSDHNIIVQGTASSSSADVPQTTVPQDPCSSSPHPNLSTLSTEGAGRQAGPSDHNIIVQGTASSSSADVPQTTVPQDPCSSSPHVTQERRVSGGPIGEDFGEEDVEEDNIEEEDIGEEDIEEDIGEEDSEKEDSEEEDSEEVDSEEEDIGEEDIEGDQSGEEDIEKEEIEEEDIREKNMSEEDIEQRALTLEPKHKIFLSHSGKQKPFTTYLCEALEKRGHEPFFDRRDLSLRKGEKFAQLIIKAAKQCEMLVVVVSEDYFMSKWPMIELSAFIQARKQRSTANATKPKYYVLPLFYELSIKEVSNHDNLQKWYKKWYEDFSGDDRINVEEWKEAVEQLPSFNGIPYNHGDLDVYRSAIVSSICFSIPPPPKWDVNHVQGMSNICEVVRKKINEQESNIKVIGFHGVGGGGKTTMCKVLCNDFVGDFEGRVCLLEFQSKDTNFEKLLRKALMSLANLGAHDIERLDEDQCLAELRKFIRKEKVFMAIDNVWDDDESDAISKARKLVRGPFHKESVVVVTSRSLGTLKALNINEKSCFEVPDLGKGDAMNLFKYHAFPEKKSLSEVEKEYVLKCVARCNFAKGKGQRHYHPLALEALGMQFTNLSLENPLQWEAKLQKMMAFDHLYGGNRVFGILKIGFDELSEDDQNLFMDVAYFLRNNMWIYDMIPFDTKWLCCVHEKDEVELQLQLDILKRRGFLQHVEWTSQEFQMHDLYVEFAWKEIRGTFNKSDVFDNQKWIQMNVCDPIMRRDRNWSKLTRLCVQGWMNARAPLEDYEVFREWDLQYFSRLEVLLLKFGGNFDSLTLGTLNLEPMKCLQSITVVGDMRCFHEVKGMEKLKQLYYCSWSISRRRVPSVLVDHDEVRREDFGILTTIGRFPPSLKILKIDDRNASICPSAVDQCSRVEDIFIRCIPTTIINLSKLSSLKELTITRLDKYSRWRSSRKELLTTKENQFFSNMELNQIRGLQHLVFLKKLVLESCEVDGHSKVNLEYLTRLQELRIYDCRLRIQCWPPHLQSLHLYQGRDHNEDFLSILKTNALRDLKLLKLTFRDDFKGSTDFKDVGRWPSLKKLQLLGCNILKLPDLSESTKLKTLIIGDRDCMEMTLGWFYHHYEFHFSEDEALMLSKLPRLQPVYVGYDGLWDGLHKYIVDFSRLVLIKQNVRSKRALERELGVAPYKLHTFIQNWENATEVEYIHYYDMYKE